MKLAIAGLFTLGLVAAFCAAILVISLRGAGRMQAAPAAKSATVEVLVAAHPLQAITVVNSDAVTTKVVTRDQGADAYLTSAVQVVGKVLLSPMVEGQPFTRASFASEGSGVHLASALPEGKRAMGISVTDYAGLEGLLYPGSMVDVLATFKAPETTAGAGGQPISTTLLEAVQVLAIEKNTVVAEDSDKNTDNSGTAALRGSKAKRVTLLVDSRQAKQLQLAQEQGTLSLALRNPLDARAIDKETISLGKLAGIAPKPVREVDLRPAPKPTVEAPKPTPEPVKPAAAPVPVAAPAPTPAPAQWETQVLRGGVSETRRFPLPADAAGAQP